MTKLKDIFDKITDETILLPDFQRDYKWNHEKQKNLIASLLLQFPIGSSLIVKGLSTEFASRRIGELNQTYIAKEYKCDYLLDGQQRTTTLFNAFNNVYSLDAANIASNSDITESRDRLTAFVSGKANSMKVRWFLRIPLLGLGVDCPDIFGAKSLQLSQSEIDVLEPNDILDAIIGYKFDEKQNLGVTKWYSPFYEQTQYANGVTSRQLETKLVNKCAKEGLIPLYHLGDAQKKGNRIIKRVLALIAKENSRTIWDSLGDNIEEYRKFDVNDELHDFKSIEDIQLQGEDKDEVLGSVFDTLAEQWADTAYEYLVHNVYSEYELTSINTSDITRAIPIFCHINEGGMKLDDFDLLAARAAKKISEDDAPYSLSQVVRDLMKKPLELSDSLSFKVRNSIGSKFSFKFLDSTEDGIPTGYLKSSILSICSLICYSKRVGFFNDTSIELKKDDAKSKALLSLSTQEIRDNIEVATLAVLRAISFLNIECGVSNAKKLHYNLMIQPIAFAFTNSNNWHKKESLAKLKYWYFSSLLSGAYIYNQSAVVMEDINNLYRWLEGCDYNEVAKRASKVLMHPDFSSKSVLTMNADEAPGEAIKSGILQFVLSSQPYDLLQDKISKINSFQLEDEEVHFQDKGALHDHHLIPVDICKELGEKSEVVRNDRHHILNSPLNRILISNSANLIIGSLGPAQYFTKLGESGSYSNEVLNSNFIPIDFKDINTGNCAKEIIAKTIEIRFDLLKEQLERELLHLKTIFA